jgi:hypothetical protein
MKMLSKNVIFLIKQRLLDIAKQEFDAVLSVSSKCYCCQYVVTDVCLQEYLCKLLPETALLVNSTNHLDQSYTIFLRILQTQLFILFEYFKHISYKNS